VAKYKTLDEARQPVDRALRDQRVLLVVDNVESVLPSPTGREGEGDDPAFKEIFDLLNTLLAASPQTRLLLTTREMLPEPFNQPKSHLRLGALSQLDAIDLVSHVLAAEGVEPPATDPGETPEEVEALVEAVGCHARALVLIAREVAARGVVATTESLGEIMAALEASHPGERENSLFASLELSLQRLTEDGREALLPLSAFHGGYYYGTLVMMLGEEAVKPLTDALIGVGLAELKEYSYIQLDPTLPPYLWMQMTAKEQASARERWGQAMRVLIRFLYQQNTQDWQMGAQLTRLELSNLLAALDWAEDTLAPEEVVDFAGKVEQLLTQLDRPRALLQAIAARERAAKKLGDWNHAQFQNQRLMIERTLAAGNLPAAHETAQKLLQRALAAGEGAYDGSNYDIAVAYIMLGRVLNIGGAAQAAQAALEPLAEAQRRFEALGKQGAGMASTALNERADCLLALGRLEESVAFYELAIKLSEELDRQKDVAVSKGQLGTARMYQRRYQESLGAHAEARVIFEGLGEPAMVAVS
jgi:tetratricopeptide (TPR) repeat protein